jgi:hypothetical protein
MGFTDRTYEIPLICGSLFFPLVLVISLWVLQKKIPKARMLYLCSIVSFIVISGACVVDFLYFNHESAILMPGFVLTALFVGFSGPCNVPSSITLWFGLMMVFSEIFYTVILFGAVKIISHIKGKYLCRKTD